MEEPKKKDLLEIRDEIEKLTKEEENESAAIGTSSLKKTKAEKLLQLEKKKRKGKKYKLVQVDNKTWKEVEIT